MNSLKLPKTDAIWEHIENGRKYEILLFTNLNCENKKYIPTVVYEDLITGKEYSRPLEEWNLRFIDVTSIYKKDGCIYLSKITPQ